MKKKWIFIVLIAVICALSSYQHFCKVNSKNVTIDIYFSNYRERIRIFAESDAPSIDFAIDIGYTAIAFDCVIDCKNSKDAIPPPKKKKRKKK